MASGGKRKGAGMPKGKKLARTLEKERVAAELRQRTLRAADNLWNAQYSKAVGSKMVFRKDEIGSGKDKKIIHTLVEDPDEIKALLDAHDGEDGKVGDDYYFITVVPPDNKAIDSMLDRTFGKPQQNISVEEITPELSQLKSIIEAEAKKKGISYPEELQNYLGIFKGRIKPEIEEKLASELIQ